MPALRYLRDFSLWVLYCNTYQLLMLLVFLESHLFEILTQAVFYGLRVAGENLSVVTVCLIDSDRSHATAIPLFWRCVPGQCARVG